MTQHPVLSSEGVPRSYVPSPKDSGYETTTQSERLLDALSDDPIPEETSHLDDGGADDGGCSDIGSMIEVKDDYIGNIADGLVDKLLYHNTQGSSREPLVDPARDRITKRIQELLEAFALKVGHTSHDGPETRMNRDVMVFVYKHGQRITQTFMEKYFRQDENSSQYTGVSDIERDDSPGMTIWEKLDLWKTKGAQLANNSPKQFDPSSTDNDNQLADTSPNQSVRVCRYPSTQASNDVSDGNLNARLNTNHKFLSETTAYNWLLSRLRQELDLAPAEPNIMSKIRETIISSLPKHHVSRKTRSETYMMAFELEWDPRAFIREQEYKEEPEEEVIGMALTLTGSTRDVQALSCAQYLTQVWSSTGNQILQLVKDVIRGGFGIQDLPDNTKLEAWTQGSKFIAKASGTVYSLAEIGEQLAWLGAALQSRPENIAVVYCQPEIVPIYPHKTLFSHQDRFWNLEFKFRSEVESTGLSNGQCWFNLFSNTVVVEGYPILARPEYETGLEIALDIVAELTQTRFATIFNGRVFIKGFCAMLTVAKRVGDVFIWHLIANKDKSYISYSDPRLSELPSYDTDKVVFSCLGGARHIRHIVGWCDDAKSYTGEPDANYEPDYSLLESRREGFFVKDPARWSEYIRPQNTAAVGNKNKGILFSGRYVDQLIWLRKKKWVVLYDVKDSRGWLVNGASALLHLVRASLAYEKDHSVDRREYIFKMREYEAEPTSNDCRAFYILKDNANRDQALLHESGETFEKRVGHIYANLELALAYEEHNNSEKATVQGKLEGFFFRDIAETKPDIRYCVKTLDATSSSWQNLTRGVNAAILFGSSFGELIMPISTQGLCPLWNKVPTQKDYLAACVSDLKKILRDRGNQTMGPWHLISGVCWCGPRIPQSQCSCGDAASNGRCELAQVLLPKAVVDGNHGQDFTSPTDPPAKGAFIFGCHPQFTPYWEQHCNKPDSSNTSWISSVNADSGYGSGKVLGRPSGNNPLATVAGQGLTSSSEPSLSPYLSEPSPAALSDSLAPGSKEDVTKGNDEPTMHTTDHRTSGAPSPDGHSAPNKELNNTTSQSTRPSSALNPPLRIIAIVAAFIAAGFNLNFYWRTVVISLMITLVYCAFVFPMREISLHRQRGGPIRIFSVTFIVKGAGLLLLLTWLIFLSPVHTTTYTLLDEWTEYLDRPPHEPSTIVYNPGETSEFDVFAIHGLGSNPSSAWQYRGNGYNVSWLRDILPSQMGLPKIKVTMINHQTRWDSHVPGMDFSTHARSLLEEIKRANQGKRPIIFIAHSFGGLLLKQALVLDDRRSKQVAENTRGILFLGVPHYGTKASFIGSLLSCTAYWRGSSTALLEYMLEGNPSLKTLDDDFFEAYFRPSQTRGAGMPYICNLLEMRPERIMMASLGPTVSAKSGTLQYATKNEYLDTDHRGLNKFPSEIDPNFKTFLHHFNCAIAHGTKGQKAYGHQC